MSRVYESNSLVSKPYWVFLCFILICIAAIFRFSHLGDKDFGIDEILHVYAAQELLQDHVPLLPSGYAYERGLPYTYLVAVMGYLGGFTELNLRIPSAILGVVVVFFVYWMTQRWFSVEAGLVAAFFTALSPMEIAHSREVRMYMLFQLLFLLIAFFFFEGFETSSRRNTNVPKLTATKKWTDTFQVRPLFLCYAGMAFLLALGVHKLILPAMSGFVGYVLVMGIIGVVSRSIDSPVRQKYIGTALMIIVGATVGSLLFPGIPAKLVAITQEPLAWGQENADNWSYYRWLLLDEYPLVFGGLSIFLLYGFLQNRRVGLLIACVFLLPFVIQSVILPMKSYRYLLYVLPFMYMAAGVGVAGLLRSLWSAGHAFNKVEFVPNRVWKFFVSIVLMGGILGVLINMPWFMRTVKDFAQDFQSPHVTDVQHHNWGTTVQYIESHAVPGDVIVSGYPLLSRHYGATQPLYFMNNAYLVTNINRDLKNEQGQLIDYTFGVPVLQNLDDLKQIMKRHPSGWVMTYEWRKDRFWNYPDLPETSLGTFPVEVIRYIKEHLERQKIPNAPYMALWRWDSRS
ncbi:glycosyltransferase family 39 protein [Candidatus Nitrospira salsa]